MDTQDLRIEILNDIDLLKEKFNSVCTWLVLSSNLVLSVFVIVNPCQARIKKQLTKIIVLVIIISP